MIIEKNQDTGNVTQKLLVPSTTDEENDKQ